MKGIKPGYKFKNTELLNTALTHPSHRNESGGDVDNQRLEFLGDAVIGCVAADVLERSFPDSAEGELSVRKSSAVSGENLALYAKNLGLGKCLLLGKGEEKEGRERASNLADAFEAVAGAVFLDGGYEAAREFVSGHLLSNMESWSRSRDHKSELQKLFHKRFCSLPVYSTVETGPANKRYFFSEVGNGSEVFGRGQGSNKKEAEQRAAGEALENLRG